MNLQNKLKMVKLGDITPYAKNAKKHSDAQIDMIKKSLENNDYYSPIGIDENNIVVVGHGRLEAMKQLKQANDLIEVVDFSYLNAKQIKKLRIMDNKIVSDDWDKELLEEEIENLFDILSDDEKTFVGIDNKLDTENIKEIDYKQEFQVVIDCVDEVEQESVFNKLTKEGIECRLLAL